LGEIISISIEACLCPKTKSSYEGAKVTGQREAFFHHKVNESIRPIHLHFRHLVEIESDKTQTRKCLMSKHITKTHTILRTDYDIRINNPARIHREVPSPITSYSPSPPTAHSTLVPPYTMSFPSTRTPRTWVLYSKDIGPTRHCPA
jgi:hypothetical protein